MLLSIIIVNYHSGKLLENCLSSIQENLSPSIDHEIILVNNESSNLKLGQKNPVVSEVINNRQNLGFSKACNLGAQKAQGKFLLFLNPDTELVDDSLTRMIREIEKNKNLKILGPKIIKRKNGKIQKWICGERTSLKTILLKKIQPELWNRKNQTPVDWVSGAALLTEKDFFHALAGFDENFFMYFEDQDFCLRAKKHAAKNQIAYFPLAQIVHHEGSSWGNNNRLQKEHYYASQDYFFQKHHSKLDQNLLKILRKLFKH